MCTIPHVTPSAYLRTYALSAVITGLFTSYATFCGKKTLAAQGTGGESAAFKAWLKALPIPDAGVLSGFNTVCKTLCTGASIVQ